jgi:hypothetical protein
LPALRGQEDGKAVLDVRRRGEESVGWGLPFVPERRKLSACALNQISKSKMQNYKAKGKNEKTTVTHSLFDFCDVVLLFTFSFLI